MGKENVETYPSLAEEESTVRARPWTGHLLPSCAAGETPGIFSGISAKEASPKSKN